MARSEQYNSRLNGTYFDKKINLALHEAGFDLEDSKVILPKLRDIFDQEGVSLYPSTTLDFATPMSALRNAFNGSHLKAISTAVVNPYLLVEDFIESQQSKSKSKAKPKVEPR